MINNDLAIGIDLGTTFCCIGVYIDGKGIEIIPNKANETTFPSIVTISQNGIFACDQAVSYIVKEPKNTIYGIKRIMGLNFKDKSVQEDIKLWPFDVVKSDENDYSMVKINVNGQTVKYYPEEISAIILKRLKAIAEDYLEKTVKYAVITVPAYFSNNQREATKKAGKLAGLEVLRIINEPTAAALAYGLDKKYGKLKQSMILNDFLKLEQNNDECETSRGLLEDDVKEKNILVFDLGGGTFDVTLVNIVNNEKFEVKNTSGNTHLGGEDFDQVLVDYCVQEFLLKNKNISEGEIKNNKKGLKRLKVACEKSKKLLSITEEISIYVDNFYQDESISIDITRAKFEEKCKNIFAKLIQPIDEVTIKSNISISDINEVILVGGSTRIPKIKEIINGHFEGIKINDTINPDEAVAYGAAIDAYKIHSNKKDILNNIVLLDTTPFSLGLGVGNNYQLIIPKGSTIPTSITNMGVTEWDNQYSVELPIYEGEYNDLSKNHFLGQFEITDIPRKKAGEIIFDVTYQVDVDGILTVTAVMQDDPSKKNWRVIKNDNIGLSSNDLKKRNLTENFNANNFIEEFKENNNLKKRMKKVHKLYEETSNFNKKMQYLKNFCKLLSEFIDTFNSNSLDNDTVFEKYYIYLKGLFDSYNVYFSKKVNEDKNFKKEVIEKINNYFKKISVCDSYYIKHLIDILYGIKEENYEMFQEVVINLMGIMLDRGREILNNNKKWSKHRAKNAFNDALNLSSTYLKEEDIELLEDTTLGDKWREYLRKCNESIKKINASASINLNEDRNSYQLYQKKESEDEEYLELVLDNYREALRQLEENDEQKIDLELEAICLANIAKIRYKFFNHNNKISILKEIKDISNKSIKMGMMAVNEEHKNVENTNWFKEIKEIDLEINEYLLLEEEKAEGGFKLQIKKDNKEIFDELEKNFEKDNFEIIKYILSKYPPLEYEYKPDIVKSQWEQNKKNLVYNLCTKYAVDLYPKETNQEKLKYTIISEISTKINSIYNEVK